MKAVLSCALIFCAIWESKQEFHLAEPGLYVSGNRIEGDELIYERHHTFEFYATDYDVFYPSKSAPVSFYKITRVEFKDYDNNYHVNIGGDINSFRIRLEIDKKFSIGEQDFKIWMYGIYVGPCKSNLPSNYYEYRT